MRAPAKRSKINSKLEFDCQMLIKKSGDRSVISENSDEWMRARMLCSLTQVIVKMDTGKNPKFQNASGIVNVRARSTNFQEVDAHRSEKDEWITTS